MSNEELIEEYHKCIWHSNEHNHIHASYWQSLDKIDTYGGNTVKVYNKHDIFNIFKELDIDKYNCHKFTISDYTFYLFGRGCNEEHGGNGRYYTHTIIMDYHGFRRVLVKAELYVNKVDKQDHNIIEADYDFYKIWKALDKDSIEFTPIEDPKEELFGYTKGLFEDKWKKITKFNLSPSAYPSKKGYETKGKIDLDHFIKMETKDGLYKPSKELTDKLFIPYDHRDIVKGTVKKLCDLGITKVHLRNNAAYNIGAYYNLEGISVKASKSTFDSYRGLVKYSEDEAKLKKNFDKKDKELEARIAKEKYDNEFTLMFHGKEILTDVHYSEIVEFFERKDDALFETWVVNTGKKCFEACPELKKVFFFSYGVYTYTELSGERFVRHEDFKGLNDLKGITLPKRLVSLYEAGGLELPCIDKDDSSFKFEPGATFVGVEKKGGKIVMISEEGDQGI